MRLGDVILPSSQRNRNGECTRVYSVTNSNGFVPSEEYFNKEVYSKELDTYRVVNRGMLAYNPSRINVGSVALQDKEDQVVVSPLYVVFSVDERRIAPEYLLRFLKCDEGLKQIETHSVGTVRNNLKYKGLCNLRINLPSLKAQHSMVRKLRVIETLIDSSQSCISMLDQLVKSQFVEMFGDPTNGVAWPYKRLDEICTIVTGNTPPRKDPSNYGDYIEWCKTDNITDAKYLTTASEMLSEEGALRGRIVPAGSILMACIAGSVKSIGKVAVADRSVAFNQQINALIPSEMIDVEYLLWALRLSKDYLCSGVNMQLKGILNKTSLSAKSFCVPPLALQQQFAAFVAEVDKSRFVVQRQIEKLRTLYDSLAQEYFG